MSQRYNNTETMLQKIQYDLYHVEFMGHTDWSQETSKDLLHTIVKELSEQNEMNLFFVWHLLKGIYVPSDDFFAKFIKNKRDFEVMKNQGNATGTWKEYLCYDEKSCQPSIEAFDKLDEKVLKKYEKWIAEPTIHGNMEDDDSFVLIPLCKFGPGQLENCDLFQKSKVSYQDETCFTFDPQGKSLILVDTVQ